MKSLFTIVCLTLILTPCQALKAQQSISADFTEAFEKLLKFSSSEFVSPESDKLWEEVLNTGGKTDVAAASWKVLNDPSKKSDWSNAIGIASSANVSSKDLATWAKKNLDVVVTIYDRKLQSEIVMILSQHGNRTDASHIRELADRLPPNQADLAAFHRKTAELIVGQIEFSEWMKKQSDHPKGNAPESNINTTSETHPVQPPPKATVQAKPEQLHTEDRDEHDRLVWLLVILGTTIGAAWLLVRKRK